MQIATQSQHIYERSIVNQDNDSLALLAQLITPSSIVLDLGMGTGALGRYLAERQAITIDGVTLSQDEANRARNVYRKIQLADLDTIELDHLFDAQKYDFIVCADVLEHLKNPERILKQAHQILKPNGKLLASVPNVAYCGLLSELLQGEFQYREEGLLDATHLRFFTRQSLHRFFSTHGWFMTAIQTTTRDILSSEFTGQFNHLPPTVSRYLLSLPDATTYQFICTLEASPEAVKSSGANFTLALPLFSSQLYLALDGQYDETHKIVQPGTMGGGPQTLHFVIPSLPYGEYTRLRLDPADRPGFMRLFEISLYTNQESITIWDWEADREKHNQLEHAHQQQISWSPPWGPTAQRWLQLTGDDPWIELPVKSDLLHTLSRHGGKLTFVCSWPMSADYLQANQKLHSLQSQLEDTHALNAQLADYKQSLSNIRIDFEETRKQLDQSQINNYQLTEFLAQAHRNFADIEQLLIKKQQQLQDSRVHKIKLSQRLSKYSSEAIVLKDDLQSKMNELTGSQNYIFRIENSKLFRWTRPLSHLKYVIDDLLGLHPINTNYQSPQLDMPQVNDQSSSVFPGSSVDIIVPVYRGLEDTQRCIFSVLANTYKTPWQLVVINDCSPEPEITQWLREMATQEPRMTLLENKENLGFVATVNKGMQLNPDRDVLLLNSDTEVANDWLDRIQRAAYSLPQVGTVTPFSNNATICSYPRFCEVNDLPDGHTTASLDLLCAKHLAGHAVSVPTGVGFCMYIRRDCLSAIGDFDEEHFGKGYGEENDFCIRAQHAGWSNLHLFDTFVRHVGGISFGASKNERELNAMQVMHKLHPHYEIDVQRYIAKDPAKWARRVLDLARILDSNKPVILNVTHNREGGTLRHLQEMGQHLAEVATFLRLSPTAGGVELRLEGRDDNLILYFALPQEQTKLVAILKHLQVAHVHYHHLLDHTSCITELPKLLGVAHDFTVHDYYSYCPQISLTDASHIYCGEKGLNACQQCLKRNPAPGNISIENWRSKHAPLIKTARNVICPSADTAERIYHFVPNANLCIVPHSKLYAQTAAILQPTPTLLESNKILKIVVIGALSQIKGADVVESVALLAAQQQLPIQFHLIGFAYRQLKQYPNAYLTIHGPYEDRNLLFLLDKLDADIAWFPAQCPETYSYTLSACLEKGLPVVAPDLGAFCERLAVRTWSWIVPWQQTTGEWAKFFIKLRNEHFLTGVPPSLNNPPKFSTSTNDYFSYRTTYLKGLIAPTPLNTEELLNFAIDICHIPSRKKHVTTASKGYTLQLLLKFKYSNLLSPLVRILPLHLQRRIKSWLLR